MAKTPAAKAPAKRPAAKTPTAKKPVAKAKPSAKPGGGAKQALNKTAAKREIKRPDFTNKFSDLKG
jgi:hypothetical protein